MAEVLRPIGDGTTYEAIDLDAGTVLERDFATGETVGVRGVEAEDRAYVAARETALAASAAADTAAATQAAAREAALAVLEKPVAVTGTTVAQVRTSATAEVERIRAAVSVIIGG